MLSILLLAVLLSILTFGGDILNASNNKIKKIRKILIDHKQESNHISLNHIKEFETICKNFSPPLTIKAPKIFVDEENSNYIYVSGQIDVFGIHSANVMITLNAGVDHHKKIDYKITLAVTLPEKGWKIFDYYQHVMENHGNLLHNPLAPLMINGGMIILSNTKNWISSKTMPREVRKFYHPVWKHKNFTVKLRKGVNIFGRLDIGKCKDLKAFCKLFSTEDLNLVMWGTLGKKLNDMKLTMTLDCPFNSKLFPPSMKAGEISMTITGQPKIGAEFALTCFMPPHKDKIKFEAFASLSLKSKKIVGKKPTRKLKIGVSDHGVWHDAMGIKGLTIDKLVLEGEIDLISEIADIGFAGEFKFADKKLDLAAKIPVPFTDDLDDVAFSVSLNKLTMKDIVNCAIELQIKSGHSSKLNMRKIDKALHLDQIELKPLKFSIAAKEDLRLGIKQGITLVGGLYIFGHDMCDINVHVNTEDGIIGKAFVHPFNIGPFQIRGHGKKDKGPKIDLAITLSDIHLHIAGEIDFLHSTGIGVEFNIGRNISAEFEAKLFGDILDVKLTGPHDLFNGKGGKFSIRTSLKETALNHFEDLISGHIKMAGKAIDKGFDRAQKTLKSWQGKVNSLNKQIQSRENFVRANRNRAIRKIDDAENKVNHLQSLINEKKNKKSHLKWYQKPFEGPVLEGEIIGLEAAKAIADGVLETIKRITKIIPVDADPVVISLKFLKGTATALLKAAEKVLAGCKKMNDTFDTILEDALSFHIKYIEVDLNNISPSALAGSISCPPALDIVVIAEYKKKSHEIHFTFDFLHPISSSFEMAKAVFSSKPVNLGLTYFRLKGNHVTFIPLDDSSKEYLGLEDKEKKKIKKYNQPFYEYKILRQYGIFGGPLTYHSYHMGGLGSFNPLAMSVMSRSPHRKEVVKKVKKRVIPPKIELDKAEKYHKHLLNIHTKEDFSGKVAKPTKAEAALMNNFFK